MKQAAERLKQAVSAGVFLTDEPMSRHTTFRTGGPADIYIEPSCAEELKQVFRKDLILIFHMDQITGQTDHSRFAQRFRL